MAIVVETDAQLEELRQHLRDAGPRAYKMYYHVDFHIKHGKYGQRFVVNKWPNPNIVFQNTYGDMWCSLDDSCQFYTSGATTRQEIEQFFRHEDVIDWKHTWIFAGLLTNTFETVKEIGRANGSKFDESTAVPCDLLELRHPVEERPLPEGYHFAGPVSGQENISEVNNLWKFGGSEGSRRFIEACVSTMHSVTVRDTSGNLVAMELQTNFGAVGTLYVDPEHRGKGIAKSVMAKLAKLIQNDGDRVFCYVEKDHPLSFKLHTNFGYERMEEADSMWVRCEIQGEADTRREPAEKVCCR